MTKEELENWVLSRYNEGTIDQLDYYLNEKQCCVGDTAYMYTYETDSLDEMRIVKIIVRSDDTAYYDSLDKYVLVESAYECGADTGVEFITDNDCYLVWFKYA